MLPPVVQSSGSEADQLQVLLFDDQEQSCLAQIIGMSAAPGDDGLVPWSSLEGVHIDCIDRLAAQGVLSRSTDEFGEVQVSCLVNKIEWSLQYMVGEPRLLCQQTPSQPILRWPKLAMILQLSRTGFEFRLGLLAPWAMGEPLVCLAGFTQPASYFAALLDRARICAPGIEIMHDMPDHYYRCLLQLKVAALLRFVADVAEQPDSFFKQKLKDSLAELPDVPEVEVEVDGLRALEDGDAGGGVPPELEDVHIDAIADGLALPALTISAMPDAWRRALCTLTVGEPYELRVYFDHYSHSSGVQRGFVNCDVHGCIKYEFVTLAENRHMFCAYMVAWHQAKHRHGTKHDHLGHRPSREEVDEVAGRLQLVEF